MKIRVKPPKEEKSLVFTDAEAIVKWARNELLFWEALKPPLTSQPRPLQWESIRNPLGQLIELDPERNDYAERAELHLNAVLTVLQFTSQDPRADFLHTLVKAGEDPTTVGLTRLGLLDASELNRFVGANRWSAAASQALAYRAVWFGVPSKGSIVGMKRALNRLHEQEAGLLATIQEEHAAAVQARADFDAESATFRNSVKDEWKETLAEFRRDQDALREKLTVELSLRAPVEYWTDKAARHQEQRSRYLKWFAGLAVGGTVALGLLAASWLVPTMGSDGTAWWAVVLFSGLVAVWAWPMRLTSKLFLAHTHLAEEASEKGVVTKTYLALDEVVGLTDQDRQILLATVFRPSSGGLVSDDGALNIADLFVARLADRG